MPYCNMQYRQNWQQWPQHCQPHLYNMITIQVLCVHFYTNLIVVQFITDMTSVAVYMVVQTVHIVQYCLNQPQLTQCVQTETDQYPYQSQPLHMAIATGHTSLSKYLKCSIVA